VIVGRTELNRRQQDHHHHRREGVDLRRFDGRDGEYFPCVGRAPRGNVGRPKDVVDGPTPKTLAIPFRPDVTRRLLVSWGSNHNRSCSPVGSKCLPLVS